MRLIEHFVNGEKFSGDDMTGLFFGVTTSTAGTVCCTAVGKNFFPLGL